MTGEHPQMTSLLGKNSSEMFRVKARSYLQFLMRFFSFDRCERVNKLHDARIRAMIYQIIHNYSLFHFYRKKKIAAKIAEKIVAVNGPRSNVYMG